MGKNAESQLNDNASQLLHAGKQRLEAYEFKQAYEHFASALEEDPNNHEALFLAGSMLRDTGDIKGGLSLLERGAQVAPTNAAILYNLGLTHLLLGNWEEGYKGYALRNNISGVQVPNQLEGIEFWQGQANKNAHVAIWKEQGIGDVMMAAAMIPEMLSRIGSITWEVDSRLLSLVQRSFPEVNWVTELPNDPYSWHAPVMNIFPLLAPEARRSPRDAYLNVDEDRKAHFQQQLQSIPGKQTLGFSWISVAKPTGPLRSIPLSAWTPLFAQENTAWFCLQYGDAGPALESFKQQTGITIHRFANLDVTNDIDGLAAAIAALNGIVSIDTSTVHLAGAIGTPCTTLLSLVPDWRWGLTHSSSSWYKEMQLLRQTEFRRWDDVMDQAATLMNKE